MDANAEQIKPGPSTGGVPAGGSGGAVSSEAASSRRPTAIVTGASSGLGRCIALELVRRGWDVVAIARRESALNDLVRDCGGTQRCRAVTMDLERTDEIAPRMAELLGPGGVVPGALFNNAGFGHYAEFLAQPRELHERLWRVNHLAAVEMTRAVLPGMLHRRRGHVINTCSMSTKIGPWGHAGYAASKAALVSITQSLAAEHPAHHSGVHFSYVNPGIVKTAYFENDSYQRLWPKVAPRAVPPEMVARKMVGLLERPRLQLCVPWYYRMIEVIEAISPTLAHRIVAGESRPAAAQSTEHRAQTTDS